MSFEKTILVICILTALLLTSSVYGYADDEGKEAENTAVAEDETAARTILVWASGAHMESPYDAPIAASLNRMMEEEIPAPRQTAGCIPFPTISI